METPELADVPLGKVASRRFGDAVAKEDSGYSTATATPSSIEFAEIDGDLSRPRPKRRLDVSSAVDPARGSFSGIREDEETIDDVTLEGFPEDASERLPDRRQISRPNSKLVRSNALPGSETSPGPIDSRFRELTLDPVRDRAAASSPLFPDRDGGSKRSFPKTASTPYPVTPVKSKRRKGNFPISEFSLSSDEEYSPIFGFGARRDELAKRSDATPARAEKNRLLYPEIKPVTPPKKIRTPEKSKRRASSAVNAKCRKSLLYSGIERVDFLKSLGEKQLHLPAIERILGHLSDEDLENASRVSLSWRAICLNDPASERRLRAFSRAKLREKENPVIRVDKKMPAPSSSSSSSSFKRCLSEVHNHMNMRTVKKTIQRSPPASPRKLRFNKFMKARSVDLDGRLRSCPRCQCPARIHGKYATCSGMSCGFNFCVECQAERMNFECCHRQIESSSPSKQTASKSLIGSKASKRNLRRL